MFRLLIPLIMFSVVGVTSAAELADSSASDAQTLVCGDVGFTLTIKDGGVLSGIRLHGAVKEVQYQIIVPETRTLVLPNVGTKTYTKFVRQTRTKTATVNDQVMSGETLRVLTNKDSANTLVTLNPIPASALDFSYLEIRIFDSPIGKKGVTWVKGDEQAEHVECTVKDETIYGLVYKEAVPLLIVN